MLFFCHILNRERPICGNWRRLRIDGPIGEWVIPGTDPDLQFSQVDRRCILASSDPPLEVNTGLSNDLNIGEVFRTNIDSSATRVSSCRYFVRAGWNVNDFEKSFLVRCVVQHGERLMT